MRWEILQGDVLERLAEIESESVQTCITSPPYWGLRDYGTATWEGGDEGCDHSTPRSRGDDIRHGDKQGTSAGSRPNTQSKCSCGAIRVDSQLGLEPTPEAYVKRMVAVFREVRRVLRDDGTLWLNLGDSYNSGAEVGRHGGLGAAGVIDAPRQYGVRVTGLKPKDLVGIPWRVAFALQADGWTLRSDIIWAKPNSMPESVTDRPTKSHEYLFLLSKSPRYYYDADAISEPIAQSTKNDARLGVVSGTGRPRYSDDQRASCPSGMAGGNRAGRNRRTVWTIPTQPFPGAHFAVFPPSLVEPCILAGSREDDLVIDPFAGSGTVGVVCRKHQRRFLGIELNPEYATMARGRLGADVTDAVTDDDQPSLWGTG